MQNEAVDVDIDEILDMDSDDIRRSHLFVSIDLANLTLNELRTWIILGIHKIFYSSSESLNNVKLQTIWKGYQSECKS